MPTTEKRESRLVQCRDGSVIVTLAGDDLLALETFAAQPAWVEGARAAAAMLHRLGL